MTRDDEKRPATPERVSTERTGERDERGATPPEPERTTEPTPEEAPELLGERSDYPIAWEPSADDGRER